MDRYSKHIILDEIGLKGQEKLQKAKVLVIGAGGLGCPILQYLAAAGIGQIGIVDFDIVEKSNLQRQVLYGTNSLGKNKALAAKSFLENLNDSIQITAYPIRLTHQNAVELFNKYDVIVDGTDNFETRYLVNDASLLSNKPLVYGAIYKFEGQVSIFNYKNSASYRCLFPEKKDFVSPNCSQIGVLGVLPGIIGTMQANEVLKLILGIGKLLNNKLLLYDALNYRTNVISFKRNDKAIQNVLVRKDNFHLKNNTINCSNVKEISATKALELENTQYIDVREEHELPKIELPNLTLLPLSTILKNKHRIDTSKTLVFFCKSGIRSKKAITLLELQEYAFSVKNGIQELQKQIKNEY